MIKSIQSKNFKALRDTTIELGRFNLLIGPNGSGKSTVLLGLAAAGTHSVGPIDRVVTIGRDRDQQSPAAEIRLTYEMEGVAGSLRTYWNWQGGMTKDCESTAQQLATRAEKMLARLRVYTLQPSAIATPVRLEKQMTMRPDGAALAGVLDRLRDEHPERFEALNDELHRWIPEFDRILFETPNAGMRAFKLRLTGRNSSIGAADLSSGTLIALAILTLAYIPDPPPIIGLEDPDHGLHPRLLRDVRDAIYRLCYPEDFGEDRKPVQIIATTHSPYMVDLFRDHPEEIIICQKTADNVLFKRLSDIPHVDEIIKDAHLGDLWYSGILGGVPAGK